MPNYRRAYRPGGTFFFTVVTYQRARFLCDDLARSLLHNAIEDCRADSPFGIDAMILLPDHLHTMWTLPEGDADFSTRWGRIKKAFTQSWLAAGGRQGAVSASRRANRRRGVWQRRFWEHVIRDQRDYERHMDYIHYNPVKHGYAACPHQWPWSSFHRLVGEQLYLPEWCCGCEQRVVRVPEFSGLDERAIELAYGE